MEVGKKSPAEILKNMKIGKAEESSFGIIIPIEESEMILKSESFSVIESYPDLKSADPSFSLRIDLSENDSATFEKIHKKLVGAAMQQKKQVEKLAKELEDDEEVDFKSASKYDEKSFKLLRESGEVWGKLYHNQKTLKITAPFWRLVEKDGRKKKQKIPKPNDLIGSNLSGRICLRLKQIFMAKHKAITCVVTEVLVTEERKPVSNFDEFSDDEE